MHNDSLEQPDDRKVVPTYTTGNPAPSQPAEPRCLICGEAVGLTEYARIPIHKKITTYDHPAKVEPAVPQATAAEPQAEICPDCYSDGKQYGHNPCKNPWHRTAAPEPPTKNCPFCGCLSFLHEHDRIFGHDVGYRVECEGNCHAMTCYWHTREQALGAWNRRAAPPAARLSDAEIARKVEDTFSDVVWLMQQARNAELLPEVDRREILERFDALNAALAERGRQDAERIAALTAKVEELEREYRAVTGRLRDYVDRHGLGLGGENLDELVTAHADALATKLAGLKKTLERAKANNWHLSPAEIAAALSALEE